jgi:ABC-2 type transport system ATP-binding protein
VFLTTHFMDEAQYLAGRVAIIRSGEIVAEGAPGSLGGRATAATTIRFRAPTNAADLPDLGGERAADGTHEIRTHEPTQALQRLTRWAVDHRVELEGLEVSRPSLEDVYLEITGGEEGTA